MRADTSREPAHASIFTGKHPYAHGPQQPPQPYARMFRDDPYLAEVAYVDAQIGTLIATLEGLGLRGRTLVIATADHGEGRWKYIHKVKPEIYDVVVDPGERDNLAQHESERVAQLRARLRSLLSDSAQPPGAAAIAVDDATRANLVALGYAAATSGSAIIDEVDSLELVGDDAASKVDSVRLLAEAQGQLLAHEYERSHAAFAKLLEDDPQSPYLLGITGLSLVRLERFGAALPYLEQSVERDPGNRNFLRVLIAALEHEARTDDAVVRMRRLLDLDACADVREKLYSYAQQRGDHREQFRIFEDGARRCPESAMNLLNYAWVLATVPVDALRDGELALATAKRGIALLEGRPEPAQARCEETGRAGYAPAARPQPVAGPDLRRLAAKGAQLRPIDQ